MTDDAANTTVLVTGLSGFVGLHCGLELLKRGFRVRGSLRTLSRGDKLRDTLARHVDVAGRVEFVEADLTKDDGWAEAMNGCTYALHVASPLPRSVPKHEDELIIPARDGALRVLRAASAAGLKRVVMTSSVAAIAYGHAKNHGRMLTEDDWTDLDGKVPPYPKSKTLAERAAWDYVAALAGDDKLELVTINPGIVFGPLLNDNWSSSGEVVYRLLMRKVPGCPNVGWAAVDVRDVATAHVDAMVTPEAAGQRFCCAIEHSWFRDVALILDEHFSARGFKIPTRSLPNFALRLAAIFDRSVRLLTPELGKREDISNERIKTVLGWRPRSLKEMVIAMGESMIEHGVVPAA